MPGQMSSPSASAVSRFSRISCLTPRSRWPAARSSPTVRGRLLGDVTTPSYVAPEGCVMCTALVGEVAGPGEVDGDAGFGCRGGHFVIAHRTAGVHDGLDSGARQRFQPVGEGEERVGG